MRGPYVTPIKVNSDYFKDWDKTLNNIYRRLAHNITKNNNVFTYDIVSPGELTNQRVNYAPIEVQWLVKGRKKEKNWTHWYHEQSRKVAQESEPLIIVKKDISVIRHVEMYNKWRPLILGKPSCDTLFPSHQMR